MPNINGKLVLLRGGRIGNEWHVLDVVYRESTSTDEVRMALSMNEGTCIMECTDAYFPFVRELRENTGMEIRAMKEYPDVDRRISATSDYVKGIVRFSERKVEEEPMYSAFLTDVMNYNKDYDSKEASIALSGFVQYVVKL